MFNLSKKEIEEYEYELNRLFNIASDDFYGSRNKMYALGELKDLIRELKLKHSDFLDNYVKDLSKEKKNIYDSFVGKKA